MKQRKFAAFDIDGTFFRWQLFHELVYELKDQGLLDAEASTTLDKAYIEWRAQRTSWEDYEAEVVSAIQKHISHIKSAELELAARRVVARSGHKVYGYTAGLAKKLKAQGYFLLAISGSQQEIAELFAKKHGFDACIGMVHQRDGAGTYTGKYERFIVGRKGAIVQNALADLNLTLKDSYAIGDSQGDISMLELVQNPIAFNPDESLLKTAQNNSWPIILERKNVVYKLEKSTNGYILAETRTL